MPFPSGSAISAKLQMGDSIRSSMIVTPTAFSEATAESRSSTSKATDGPLCPDGGQAFEIEGVRENFGDLLLGLLFIHN